MRRALALMAAIAAAEVSAPRIGCVLGRDGVERDLFGVAGSFVIGEQATVCAVAQPWRAVREHDGLWAVRIDPETGGILERRPLGDFAHALLDQEGRALLSTGRSLRRGDQRWELRSAATGLRWISSGWAQVDTNDGQYALSQDGELFLLPEVEP